jgi:hypothetical protein
MHPTLYAVSSCQVSSSTILQNSRPEHAPDTVYSAPALTTPAVKMLRQMSTHALLAMLEDSILHIYPQALANLW